MSMDNWLAFAIASAIMLAIPGPTILLVISHALSHGRRAGAATVAGVALGDLVAMSASMAGLGALLTASATLFTLLKWLGAGYLIYLGIKLWRTAPTLHDEGAGPAITGKSARLFGHAFTVTALNPKSLVFFIAFVPQFMDPGLPLLPQIALMEITFVSLGALNAALYGLLASSARQKIRQPGLQRIANRTGGSLLIGAGFLTAFYRRTNG
ncbi:LysE family translocator [Kushneria aurantia]|uniref:LysE family translocator n=1 Tax=Kushneria aurantia TaxID=504092 RepID=A0ABV6G0U2_9GAMM|nr:LysE family translocator [Kushneria aurantia]